MANGNVAGVVLSAGKAMRALYVVTRRLDAAQFKARLMNRLVAAASSSPAVPAIAAPLASMGR